MTLFHSKIVIDMSSKCQDEIDFVGFHGQTIFHNPEQKISKQLGDGKLMSQLVKKKIIYNFERTANHSFLCVICESERSYIDLPVIKV